jgi:hypothetical protein
MPTTILRRLLVLFLFMSPTLAAACYCYRAAATPRAEAASSIAQSGVIFEGLVDHINSDGWPPKPVPGKTVSTTPVRRAVFSHVRFYKGEYPEQVELDAGSGGADCGYTFGTGRSYLVFASKDKSGGLRAGICVVTAPLEYAGAALRLLRGEPPSREDLRKFPLRPKAPSASELSKRKLCGNITLPEGAWQGLLTVHLWKAGQGDLLPFKSEETIAKPDGSFCFTWVEPGKYLIGAFEDVALHEGSRYAGYYPGVAERSDAKPIDFPVGGKADLVAFPLIRQSLYTVRGRIQGPDNVFLRITLLSSNPDALSQLQDKSPNFDGSFRFDNVPPGNYSAFAFVADGFDHTKTFLSAAIDVRVSANVDGLVLEVIPKK